MLVEFINFLPLAKTRRKDVGNKTRKNKTQKCQQGHKAEWGAGEGVPSRAFLNPSCAQQMRSPRHLFSPLKQNHLSLGEETGRPPRRPQPGEATASGGRTPPILLPEGQGRNTKRGSKHSASETGAAGGCGEGEGRENTPQETSGRSTARRQTTEKGGGGVAPCRVSGVLVGAGRRAWGITPGAK